MLFLAAYSPYIKPTVHPIMSCMGFTFPAFLIINICFIVFWLIIGRYRFAVLPILAILLCHSQVWACFPINLHTGNVPEGSFKVLSYNVMGFSGAKKVEGKNETLNYIENSKADIICLQEYSTIESRRHISQKDVENALKEYPYHKIQTVGSAKGYTNKVACYSKFPILSAKTIDYASEHNGSVAYELKIGNDTVMLINNHLESNKLEKEDKIVYEDMLQDPETQKVKSGARLLIRKLAKASAIRAPQADSIAKAIESSRHSHIIVCGDFNDIPISYTHRVVGKGLNDAFTQSGRGLGISYNQNKFYFRIDNILASKNFEAYNCTVDRSIKESDHYPVWCYLKKSGSE